MTAVAVGDASVCERAAAAAALPSVEIAAALALEPAAADLD